MSDGTRNMNRMKKRVSGLASVSVFSAPSHAVGRMPTSARSPSRLGEAPGQREGDERGDEEEDEDGDHGERLSAATRWGQCLGEAGE